MKNNKQPSVEETAKKFNNVMAFQLNPSNDTMKAVRLAHKMVIELLQAERQRCEEMVEAEREKEADNGYRCRRNTAENLLIKIREELKLKEGESVLYAIKELTQPNNPK